MLVVGSTSVDVISVFCVHYPVVPACCSVVDLSMCAVVLSPCLCVLWPCLYVLLCCDLVSLLSLASQVTKYFCPHSLRLAQVFPKRESNREGSGARGG